MRTTFLVVAYGEAGHVLPMLSLVQGLSRRGHRVLVSIAEKYKDGVPAAGGEYVPPHHFKDPMSRMEPFPRSRNPFTLLGRVRKVRSRMLESIPELVQDMEELIRREHVDCVVSCFTGIGARYAAERTGTPYASLSPNPLIVFNANGGMVMPPKPWMKHFPRRLTLGLVNRLMPVGGVRESLGVPASEDWLPEVLSSSFSSALHLVTVHPDFFPEATLRPGQLCVGPMSFNLPRPGATPFPVESLKPGTVMVSTTTTPMEPGLFARTLQAIAPMNVPVLATAASAKEVPTGLGEHVRIEPFVPHDDVLPHVSALVTHGGWGITGRALRLGVPMLITPLFGDQPVIARRLAEQGLAYYLPPKKATPEAIRERLTALLADRALHARVKAAAEKLKGMDSPVLAAEALEQLVERHRQGARPAA